MMPRMKRGSGILLAISSLPGRFGIGTLGEGARKFVDWLGQSGQAYWQILPISPTGFGDSPYQAFSAFAGNPYYRFGGSASGRTAAPRGIGPL